MEALYPRWIAHVFQHPPQEPDWYFHNPPLFSVSDAEFAWLFTQTMQRAGTDLTRFDDIQVSSGLKYIFDNSFSSYVFQLLDGDLPKEVKASALLSIQWLYADCLAPRCPAVLAHLNEPGSTPLNHFCFMLWEVTPLIYWEGRLHKAYFYDALLQVLKAALGSPNIACQESALHGLGHLHLHAAKQVEAIVADYLRQNRRQRPELLDYAQRTQGGYIL